MGRQRRQEWSLGRSKRPEADGGEARNAYEQALTAKYAVRMPRRHFGQGSNRYPAGAVVFVPRLPDGSELPEGDFKVSMIDLDDLGQILAATGNCEGAMAGIRRLADDLGCTRVWSVAEACDPAVAERARLIDTYGRQLVRAYGPEGNPVPFGCLSTDGGRGGLAKFVIEWPMVVQDVLVLGGSGRGKTMLAQACASGVRTARRRRIADRREGLRRRPALRTRHGGRTAWRSVGGCSLKGVPGAVAPSSVCSRRLQRVFGVAARGG